MALAGNTEFIQTSGFLCRRPDDMKLTTKTLASSYSHGLFLTITRDNLSFRSTNVDSALGTLLAVMRYLTFCSLPHGVR